AQTFLEAQARDGERSFSAQAAEALLLHPWPRNVRELLATVRRLGLHLGDRAQVTRADVDAVLEPSEPPAPAAAAPQRERTERSPGRLAGGAVGPEQRSEGRSDGNKRQGLPERDELVVQLTSLRGNVSRIAEHYQKDPKQIYRWLKELSLDPKAYR